MSPEDRAKLPPQIPPWAEPPYVGTTPIWTQTTFAPAQTIAQVSSNTQGSVPTWATLYPNGPFAGVDLDFAGNRSWFSAPGGSFTSDITSVLTITRASSETVTDTAGNISYVTNNTLAMSNAGLQVWEARTNQQTYSAVNMTGWSVNNGTLTDTSALAPDGTVSAGTILDNVTSGIHGVYQLSQAVTASQTQTSSIYIKQGSIRYVQFLLYDTSSNGISIFVDTQLGTILSNNTFGSGATYTSSAIFTLVNGWFRISLTGAMTTDTHLFQELRLSPDGSTTSYSGTGGMAFAWGAQLEQAVFAGPYIPTTSAAVSRAADVITLTNQLAFGAAYSFVAWGIPSAPANLATNQMLLSMGPDVTHRVNIYRSNGHGQFFMNGSSSWAQVGAAAATGSLMKLAAGFIANTQNGAVNGTLGTAGTSTTISASAAVHIGSDVNNTVPFNGNITRIAVYPVFPLTTANLIKVTT